MSKNVIICALLLVIGILIGANLPALSAQQREGRGGPPLPTIEQLPQEVATLRQLDPDQLDDHDGRPVALDQPVVGRQEAELAARAVLLQRVARPHPAAGAQESDDPQPGRPARTSSCRASSTASTRAAWRW